MIIDISKELLTNKLMIYLILLSIQMNINLKEQIQQIYT